MLGQDFLVEEVAVVLPDAAVDVGMPLGFESPSGELRCRLFRNVQFDHRSEVSFARMYGYWEASRHTREDAVNASVADFFSQLRILNSFGGKFRGTDVGANFVMLCHGEDWEFDVAVYKTHLQREVMVTAAIVNFDKIPTARRVTYVDGQRESLAYTFAFGGVLVNHYKDDPLCGSWSLHT